MSSDFGRCRELAIVLVLARARASNSPEILLFGLNLDLDDALTFVLVRELGSRSQDDRQSASVRERDLASACDHALRHAPSDRRVLPFLQFAELHLLSESFQPSFSKALPALGWSAEGGRLRDHYLAGPLHLSLKNPVPQDHWLDAYDAVAPATGLVLRRLREARPSWLEHREERALFLLPLLLGEEPPGWRQLLRRGRPFPRLMLFLPNPDHYEWLFMEHPQEEWAQGSASALWDLETGQVLYADGIHTEESLRTEGRPLRAWLGLKS